MATSTKKLTKNKISHSKKVNNRARTEEAIRKKNGEYQSLIDNIQAAVVVHGSQTQILTSNLMAQKLLGLTEDQLLGKTVIDPAWHFFREDGTVMPLEEYPVNQVFATKKPLRDFITGIFHPETHDHSWALVNADPVLTSDGVIDQVIVTFVDITEQKKAEKANAKLVAIVESSDDAITRKTLDGIIESWNAGAEHLYGYTAEEIVGKNVSVLAPASHKDEIKEILKKIKRGESVKHFETERVRKDGTLISISLTVSPMKDASGKMIGASSISRDITEQKRTEKLLKQSETRLNEAQRLAHIGSWELDLKDNRLVWSNEIYRMFEIDPNRFGASYEAFLDAIHPEDRDAVNTAYSTSLKNRTPYTIDHRLLFKDGRIKYAHEQCETFYDKEGKPIRSLGTVQDVTERKRIEENLRIANIYTRSLIEASLDPLVTISAEGKITDVNTATEKVTGASRHELIGTDFSDYFTDPHKARSGYQQVFKVGFVHDYALEIRHKDGQITPVLYNASLYKDESGKVIGVFAAARDITEQKKAEAEREQYFKLFMASNDLMCIADPNGAFLKTNPAFTRILGYSESELVSQPFIEFVHPDDRQHTLDEMVRQQKLGFSLNFENRYCCKNGSFRWLSWRATYTKTDGLTYATARDITVSKEAEEKILHINRLYATISQINQAIVRAQDRNTLFSEICRVAIEYGKFRMAWIGMIDEVDGYVKPIVFAGEEQGYLTHVKIAIHNTKTNGGPTGTAINEARCIICQDVANDPRMAPWREPAIQCGYRSSAAVPFRQKNHVVGTLTVYSADIQGFTDDDQKLLDEIGQDISYALDSLDAEIKRKQAEDALHEREKHSRSLLRLSRELERAQTHDDILQAVSTEINMTLGYKNIWVYLLSEDKKFFKVLTGSGNMLDSITTGDGIATLTIHGDKMLEEIVDAKGIVVVEDARIDVRTNKEIVARLGNRTIINVPIFLHDIHLGSFGTGTFDEDGVRPPAKSEQEYLTSVASHLAVALDRIHLLMERKQAEEAILKSNLYNRSLIESSLDPLVTIGPDGKITDVNNATETVTGVMRERLIGDEFSNYFTEPEKAKEGYQKVLSEGLVKDYPLTIRHTSGKTTDVLYNATVYKNESGEIQGVFAAARDITERNRAEFVLRQSEETLKEAQRIAHLGSWHMDLATNEVVWSEVLYKIYGLEPALSPPLYTESMKLFTPESWERLSTSIAQTTQTGIPYELELESVRQDGGRRWMWARGELVRDEHDTPVRVRGVVMDITERKHAEEQIQKLNEELELRVFQRTAQLEAANKELEAFAYSVSHDLRAPLRSIDGFSHILLEDYTKCIDEQGKNYLNRVRTAAQHMAELIDDMLNLSRITRSELNIQTFNFSDIAFAINDELRLTQPERSVEFITQKEIPVHGDVRLLKVVLENLLRNAWKFTSKHPTARIEFGMQEHAGEEAYFVRDDGAGFDMAYATKLFGAFQRLHTNSEFPGTGIGLATVQRIIHKHGGTLWAEGKVEQGATFYFTIP